MNTNTIRYFGLVLFTLLSSHTWAAPAPSADDYYQAFSHTIIESDLTDQAEYEDQPYLECDKKFTACQTQNEIMLQALDELAISGDPIIQEKVAAFALAHRSRFVELGEQLQLYVTLKQTHAPDAAGEEANDWLTKLENQFDGSIKLQNLDTRSLHTVFSYKNIFSGFQWALLRQRALWGFSDKTPLLKNQKAKLATPTVIHDLVFVEPNLTHYHNGEFAAHPRVYMFCRQDRSYPCLMVIKEPNGGLHRLADHTLWSQPSLGFSRHHKNYNQSNGNTPAGVFRIDGPMTDTDRSFAFGKFGRLMINMIEKSGDEELQKSLLPPSSQNETWWQEAVVARDMGRGLFRIHGTGVPSMPGTHFYPFVGTSGCVAKRENNYDGVKYVDQRLFLNELMVASGFSPTPENELKIRGLLYVINLDNNHGAVTLEDLARFGIR